MWYIVITRENKILKYENMWGGGYGYTKKVNRVERGVWDKTKVNGGGLR